MDIQLQIIIDGDKIRITEELAAVVNKVVGTYIKQKFLQDSKEIKEKKVVKRSGKRMNWSAEEDSLLINRVYELVDSGHKKVETATILSNEMGRKMSSVYTRINHFTTLGKLIIDWAAIKSKQE